MSGSEDSPKVAILGAGLLGRMLSIMLHKQFDVKLYDQDDGSASNSAAILAAAMLAPLAESAESDAEIMQMGQQAMAMWPDFIQQLDHKVFFQEEGSLIVAFEQDLAVLKQFESRLKGNDYQVLSREEVMQVEPSIDPRFAKAIFLPNEGQLDNRQLLFAMADYIKNSDIDWCLGAEVSINAGLVKVNDEVLEGFDWILDCRGIGSKQDLKSDSADLRGVRGEVLRVHAPEVSFKRPIRLMHPRYPIYIAPKENHQFVIGATQIESEDQREPTVRSALELLSACFSVDRGFAEAEILEIKSGLRPAYLDNHPAVHIHNNIISANGLYRHGYLLAPVVAEAVKELLENAGKLTEKMSFPSLYKLENAYA